MRKKLSLHKIIYCFVIFSLGCSIQLFAEITSENNSPRLVIIIDDLGNNMALSQEAARLPGGVTLSVLPFTPFGTYTAELGHSLGKEIMLHVPMSNTHAFPLGKGGLYPQMNQEEMIRVLRQDLNSLPYIKGMNNHMGSELTQAREPMEWVMGEMRSRGFYFVDSRTSNKTLAYTIALQTQVPALKRDIFLDDDQDSTQIRSQLNRAIALAKARGYALAIGHPYPATLRLLESEIKQIEAAGVHLIPASQLLSNQTLSSALQNTALITSPALNECPILPYFAWPEPKPHGTFSDILHRTLVDWLAVD